MTAKKMDLPDVHFVQPGTALDSAEPNWRKDDDPDPDDEELPKTPPHVVMMLGFDPLDEDWD